MWARLRNRSLNGIKFHRQFPIGSYIVDFFSRESKLIVEIDGGGHDLPDQKAKDQERDAYLKAQGYKVVRVWASDVHNKIESVLEYINSFL